jgi:uncharacterized protein (TIGR02600 family)
MPPRVPASNRGVALIVVLSLLVILAIMVISFFALVQSQTSSSRAELDAASVERLANNAVSLVMAQITEATTQNSTLWASQPGMVRTWTASGTVDRIFRLFSSPDMIQEGAAFDPDADSARLAGWAAGNRPFSAAWCDLNSPVTSANDLRYPIAAPPISLDGSGGVPVDNPATASTREGIQGFSVASPPGFSSSAAASPTNNPLPMPVRWIYFLQDGTIVHPVGDGNSVTLLGATASNPVVGRVAFWTDDDTAKVNINTASAGTFWDYPKTDGTGAREMGRNQPAKNEFQRYPGHPAMTSLRAVLHDLTDGELTALSPRVQEGGSLGGTRVAPGKIDLSAKVNRLYASRDELAFGLPDRDPVSKLSVDRVRRLGFFLTANSRAPETTVFETPRVSIWPITLPDAKQSYYDRMLKFAATLNNHAYYFQRRNPFSPTEDWDNIPRNRELYGYLQDMTARTVPGFGASFLGKYGTADRNQTLTQILDYVRSTPDLLGAGHAEDFAARDDGFLLRSFAVSGGSVFTGPSGMVVPLRPGGIAANTRGFGRAPFINQIGLGFFCNGMTSNSTLDELTYQLQIAPLVQLALPASSWSVPFLTGTPQFNSEDASAFGLWVRVAGQDPMTLTSNTKSGTTVRNLVFPTQPVLLARPYDRAPVISPMLPHLRDLGAQLNQDVRNTDGGSPWLVQTSFTYAIPINPATGAKFDTNPASWDSGQKPNALARWNADAAAPLTMDFSGGALSIEILAPDKTTVLHRATVNLDAETGMRVPTWDIRTMNENGASVEVPGAITEPAWTTFRDDFRKRAGTSAAAGWTFVYVNCPFGLWGDIIRSKEVSGTGPLNGDWRLAAVRDLGAGDFAAPTPAGGADRSVHSFVNGTSGNGAARIGTNARLAAGANYGIINAWNQYRSASSGLAGATMANGSPGDWDNSFGNTGDGGLINAADSGALGQLDSGSTTTRSPYFNALQIFSPPDALSNSEQLATFFSPNRQMYSPIQFGSLPSRAASGNPWETLLFCPNPAATRSNHRGWTQSPPDHLMADLFWMPIVDPYAISEPLSTAGKINLNASIEPFRTFLIRQTGLYALLDATKITAISGSANSYKQSFPPPTVDFTRNINIPSTLEQLDAKFASGEIFKTVTQICEIFFVPEGQSWNLTSSDAAANTWWASHSLTGDNSREQSYAHLLPRITTKSNTFTVHMRAQVLRKSPNSTATEWQEGRDQVVADYRGSAGIERYIDPADPTIPDFAVNPTNSLGQFYKWRVTTKNRFTP